MSRISSRINSLRLFAGVLAAGLSIPVLAQSVQFPTYQAGPQTNDSFVVADGQVITPDGIQVNLGTTTRAKAVAVNPNAATHTAAVLQMGAPQAVTIFNTQNGDVLQTYKYGTDKKGSNLGNTYTADGSQLLFSQDDGYLSVVNVDPTSGLITTQVAHVHLPADVSPQTFPDFAVLTPGGVLPVLNTVNCTQSVTFPVTGTTISAPVGTSGSFGIPCGVPLSYTDNGNTGGYPTGVAVSADKTTAYVVEDVNNELAKVTLAGTPAVVSKIRVGNLPHSVVISADGATAYVSNEGGNVPAPTDFQLYSDGTPVLAQNPTGALASGTVSVVNLSNFTVTKTINTGLHPTGMAFWGTKLLVANAYDDTISVIDTASNTVCATISLGLPVSVPGSATPAYGAGPNSIAVDQTHNIAYVALYNANAIAVLSLSSGHSIVQGMIPVGYAPSSVALDSTDGYLVVANDKGWGTTGNPPETSNSFGTDYGVTSYNTHQDLGTVSILAVPTATKLAALTKQVTANNHWDLKANIAAAAGGKPTTPAVAIPAHIGDPSLIKHVFLIIRENRTYDQILGDVAGGNGEADLAVFGDDPTVTGQFGPVTPNAHALVQRFPLLDNFYDPSRQSADGHNWIVQAMAPYSDDIQSPDWLRDYPSNGGDAIAYQNNGNLYNLAVRAGVSLKNYGEYIEENTFNPPGCKPTIITSSCEPTWNQFYQDTIDYEYGYEKQLYYYNTIGSYSPLPDIMNHTVQNYPQFDLGIPDQYRVDVWEQDFANDVKNNSVPQLELMWISSDHTGGQPTAQAMQADNDLAVGRFVDIISHSPIWATSAIFIEEDEAQTGVDHVDGHRSPGYVISPYVRQKVNAKTGAGTGVTEDKTFYTQVNFTRTIEQILGMPPMNQNDLVATPMTELFTNAPPASYFLPWTHVPNAIPLDLGVTPTEAQLYKNASPAVKALAVGWLKKKAQLFAGKYHQPDSEDPDTVNHLIWYESTGFTKPFPGEKRVRPASDFNNRKAPAGDVDQD